MLKLIANFFKGLFLLLLVHLFERELKEHLSAPFFYRIGSAPLDQRP